MNTDHSYFLKSAELAISVVTRAYSNKDEYLYASPRPPPQHTRCNQPESAFLALKLMLKVLDAMEAYSVVRIDAVVEDFLTDKGKGPGGKSGNYRRDASRELGRFTDFLAATEPPVETFEELESSHLREYARHLARHDWTARTVQLYYAYISAFCGWAVREGYLATHVAQRRNATEPLPDDTGHKSGDQQAWSAEDRQQLTTFVDQQASAAIENVSDNREAAIKACLDRALAYLLSYSGVRGAEVLHDRSDVRRKGSQWQDIDLEDRYVTVFAKKQRLDDRSLPKPVIHPLRVYQKLLDVPRDTWPVFPTFHRPTLAQRITTRLTDRGYTETELDDARADRSLIEVCLAFDITPPSMTTDGARYVLEGLCDRAGIDLTDDHDYLKPHGARRGAGEVLVRTAGYAAAARALDNSEEVVREHYSHIEAGDLADQMTTAFEQADQQTGSNSE